MSENDIEILDLKSHRDDDQPEGIEEGELLQTIWLQPRDTLKFILKNCPDKYVIQLLVIGGAVSALGNSVDGSPFFGLGIWGSLVIVTIIGAILGPLVNMIFASVLSLTGRWIGGNGNYQRVLTVVAWATVPTIAGVIFTFFHIGYFGPYFSFYDPEQTAVLLAFTKAEIILYLLAFLSSVVAIWNLVILVVGLSVAHKFSIGKAILNLLIPILAIVIPIAIIAFLFGDLMREF